MLEEKILKTLIKTAKSLSFKQFLVGIHFYWETTKSIFL